MALEQLKVKEIVRRAVNKEIDVPEFQRDFVWDPEQVKLLAESLYREYPVGSFLLWDSSAYREAKIAEGAKNSSWIVDGQQRTTALCILFGEKPYWWPSSADWNKTLARYDVMVNLLPDGDVRLEFALSNPIREKDPRWMSLREILSKEKESGRIDKTCSREGKSACFKSFAGHGIVRQNPCEHAAPVANQGYGNSHNKNFARSRGCCGNLCKAQSSGN